MRLIVALLIAGIACAVATGLLIPLLRRLKFGQNIREEGPESHKKKTGTPTMGGIAMMLAMVVCMMVLDFSDIATGTFLLAVGITLLYGLLGFGDDFIKTIKKRNLGLRAWQKMAGEILIAALLIWGACACLGRGSTFSWLGFAVTDLGVIFYILAFVLIAGVTNGVNLNDGLDGLASGVSFFVYLGYGIIALDCLKNPPFSQINYTTLAIFAFIMAGLCLGFLVFNHHPAKVFMGDTGSLFLGGGLAVLAILTGQELLLVIMGGVYVIEALSVMIQVTSFKLTGKRVFKMAPIHHHFELTGWKETKVVYVFWCASLVFVALGLLIYFV